LLFETAFYLTNRRCSIYSQNQQPTDGLRLSP